MKRTKIDALKARAAAKASAIANAEKAVEDLELRIVQLKEQAAEAANSGNFEQYQTLASSAELANKELIVKRSFLETLTGSSVPEADTLDAWAEYAKDYGKAFDKLYADFESKRKAMLKAYSDLVELQCEALTTRNELLRYVGVVVHKDIARWSEKLECKCLPTGEGTFSSVRMDGTSLRDLDAVFFLANYEKEHDVIFNSFNRPASTAERMIDIIQRRSAPQA